MEREIFCSRRFSQTRLAVMENGRLAEYLSFAENETAETGEIVLGLVKRLLPGMEAAFVDVGKARLGFLPLSEKGFSAKALKTGDSVICQVKKAAHEEKGAFLTRDASVAGRFLVYLPFGSTIGVSSKISDAKERARVKALVSGILPDGTGAVVRSAAVSASEDELKAEIKELSERFGKAVSGAEYKKPPAVLLSGGSPLERALTDYSPDNVKRVLADSKELFEEAERAGFTAELTENDPLELGLCEEQLKKALARKVYLPCGGYLVVDQCEALTVIDVNSGSNTGKRVQRETILKTNLEAAAEIARIARLRAIGGIIIVDFIDMEAEDAAKVESAMRSLAMADRVKMTVEGFTRLGLMELTRRRTGQNALESRTELCPVCGGSGRIDSAKSVGLQAALDVARRKRSGFSGEITVSVNHSAVSETESALKGLGAKAKGVRGLMGRYELETVKTDCGSDKE